MSPASDDPLSAELSEELASVPAVDAHEHLPPEREHLERDGPDFYSLFEHYCRGDLVAAGATEPELERMADRGVPVEERWEVFRPYLAAIRNGSYARAALTSMRELLEVPRLSGDTYRLVGRRLEGLRRPGEYDRLLTERCNLAACINCTPEPWEGLPDYFYLLGPGAALANLFSREDVRKLAGRCDGTLGGLDDLLRCIESVLGRWAADPRVVGIKLGQAYQRPLAFRRRDASEAEKVLQRVLRAVEEPIPAREAVPLQDFLIFGLVARARDAGLAVAIHTGLQAGNFGRIRDADPLALQGLIEEFPRARIDIFHGGMPWVRQAAVLAKYFPGVHLSMAWMHIISPAQARSALAEWLDMVPATKIIGFGGDYTIVEKVYGHLKMARRNVVSVLADGVREGSWSRREASRLGRLLMRENAERLYRLDLE